MKRRDKLENGGIFKIFERKKKPQVGGEIPPKTIRHLERPVNLPFLKDMDEGKEQYGSAEEPVFGEMTTAAWMRENTEESRISDSAPGRR